MIRPPRNTPARSALTGVAYSALEHTFEKVGDHWEPKNQKDPSDELAEGVDANAGKEHLLDVARRLDVRGRSTMSKSELVDAIKKENRRVRGR
jgi:Rho termination factor, N-terminal domain